MRAYSAFRIEDDLAMEPADVGVVESDLETTRRQEETDRE
jgi:hypothetical protein